MIYTFVTKHQGLGTDGKLTLIIRVTMLKLGWENIFLYLHSCYLAYWWMLGTNYQCDFTKFAKVGWGK